MRGHFFGSYHEELWVFWSAVAREAGKAREAALALLSRFTFISSQRFQQSLFKFLPFVSAGDFGP
jgi:hypothetical protein